ncbi:poly(ethylene terephthalate) hydrolase family protein [Actinomadura macrotermitis]|uniref:poly(ethylene terephthalate) hydrolase n=1 Tax=Actinomadura macrotermitis TaxID=2585200 RepID=A0A7K0BXG1_9ACTN|nr:acetylxylan esterase [Actinomadura macrotermitis]MQY05871.1 hypothetical protein [Actinomadura macrotermitis]
MSRRAWIAALVTTPLLATAALAVSFSPGPAPATARTVAAADTVDWAADGPYAVTVDSTPLNHTIYRPQNLGATGARLPVVIWGNGTGATPAAYDGLLKHWASYGIIVAAANTTMSNDGTAMRKGLDLLAKRDATATSPYYGKVDLAHVVSAGHSQGGAGALNAAADTRVDAVLPIEPGPLASPEKVTQPTMYMAGEKDSIVNPAWVRDFYDRSSARPAVLAEIKGATHFTPPGDGGTFRAPTTAWLQFVLRDDPAARAMFSGPACGFCTADGLFSVWLRNAKFTEFAG